MSSSSKKKTLHKKSSQNRLKKNSYLNPASQHYLAYLNNDSKSNSIIENPPNSTKRPFESKQSNPEQLAQASTLNTMKNNLNQIYGNLVKTPFIEMKDLESHNNAMVEAHNRQKSINYSHNREQSIVIHNTNIITTTENFGQHNTASN